MTDEVYLTAEARRQIRAGVEAQFPGRSTQIRALVNAFAQPDQPGPTSMQLLDTRSTRHTTALVRAVLKAIEEEFRTLDSPGPTLDTVHIPVLLAATPKLLFREIIAALVRKSASAHPSSIGVDDAIDTFVSLLAGAIRQRVGDDGLASYRLCIVIEHAHRVRDLWPTHVLLGLLNLDRNLRSKGMPVARVCVIFATPMAWEQYRHPDGNITVNAPDLLHFHPLQKADIRKYLELNGEPLLASYQLKIEAKKGKGAATGHMTATEFRNLYRQYCDLARDSMRADVSDIVDLQLLTAAVWHVFIVPIETGELRPNHFEQLFRSVKPFIKDAVNHLHSREVSPNEWLESNLKAATSLSLQRIDNAKHAAEGTRAGPDVKSLGFTEERSSESDAEYDSGDDVALRIVQDGQPQDEFRASKRQRRIPPAQIAAVPPMPSLSALLLVAAFVACYNPPRLDYSRFVREGVLGPGRRKKKGGGTAKTRASGAQGVSKTNLDRQQLRGPKPVPVERLLSVFQVLLWEVDPATLREAAREEKLAAEDLSSAPVWDEGRAERLLDVERSARSAAVFQRIKSLMTQRFLLASSKLDNLTSATVQVNITYEVAQSLGKQLKLKIEDWLHDWEELF